MSNIAFSANETNKTILNFIPAMIIDLVYFACLIKVCLFKQEGHWRLDKLIESVNLLYRSCNVSYGMKQNCGRGCLIFSVILSLIIIQKNQI